MPSKVIAGEIETNVIYIPDSTAIISTGGGSDESLKDILDSKEDRIQLPTQRAVATDPAGRLLASLVTSDEQNTLQGVNTEVTIQDQFDAVTDVVDILDSRRFEYTFTGNETGLLTFPMMKFPRMDNDHTGAIVIKGYATFESPDANSQHIVTYDAVLNVQGTSGVEKDIAIRGKWPSEATVPFELSFVSISSGGQQGSMETWVCVTASFSDPGYVPRRFSFLVETDMGSEKFASDGPYQNVPPGFTGYDFIFANEAQVLMPNASAILIKDSVIDTHPYALNVPSIETGALTVSGDTQLDSLIVGDGQAHPAIVDASGKLTVSSTATLADIDALPALRTSVARLGTAIEFDPNTNSLYLGKEDSADTIYISNPNGQNSQTIYVGSSLDQVIIQGQTTIVESTTQTVSDPYITLNVGGTTPTGAGILVESNGSNVAGMQITETGRWQITEPDTTPFVLSDRFETNEGDIAALQAQIGGGGGSLTGDRAVITNSLGSLITSEVTVAQLAQLIGVTSPIQTQLDSKQATITGSASSITDTNLTAGRAVITDPSTGKIAVSDVTSTVLGYISSMTQDWSAQLFDINTTDNYRARVYYGAETFKPWFQAGTNAINGVGSISFNLPFAEVPVIFATALDTSNDNQRCVHVQARSTTGATFRVTAANGSGVNSTVMWIALGSRDGL